MSAAQSASGTPSVGRRHRPFVFASATMLLFVVLVVEVNLHFDAVDARASDIWLMILMVPTAAAVLVAAVATIVSLWRAVIR